MMTAAITTQGVYIFANLVIKRSIFGLLAAAFSMDSRIRETIDSDNGFSTRIFNWPDVLTQPDVMGSPTDTPTGTGSPVIGEVSSRLSPSMITPSSGTLSPGRINRISSTFASSAGMTVIFWSDTRFTTSGRISTASMI